MSNPENENELPEKGKPEGGQSMSQVEAQERLGTGLKTMYRNVLDEPLPEDMLALLDQLDDSESSPSSGSQSDE